MKYKNSLKNLGLTADQSKIYETLIDLPIAPASIISKKAGVGRELTYIVLGQLEEYGLIERSNEGKIIMFRAENPRNIKRLLEDKREDVLKAEKAYQDIIVSIVSDFNVSHSKPFIRYYEGVEGLKKVHKHILKHAKKVLVLRSKYDYGDKKIRKLVKEQIEERAKKNIEAFVISPKLPHMKPEKFTTNLERKITRKVVPKSKFDLPAQIIIYNDTVSITSLKKEIVTTVIENKDIAQSFKVLFKNLWDAE